jgi:lysozyme family protein
MADIAKYFPKLLKWEGGFVNDPTDMGGATNMGVTIGTFKQWGFDNDGDGDIDVEDLRKESPEQAQSICKRLYWDRWKADLIKSQSVAESLVEWVWGSGKWGVIIPQRILGLIDDGVVGPKTLEAVNKADPPVFHEKLRIAKLNFIDGIVVSSIHKYRETHLNATEEELLKFTQKRFEKGWKRRINDFKYEP